jgi:hypothetical protein
MDETIRNCHWCSSPIPSGGTTCPKCGAVAEGAAGEIPGLTAVDPSAPRADPPDMVPNPIGWLRAGHAPTGSSSAYQVPSDDVLREMRKMELEAEILNAGTSRMDPFGDEAIDAGAPSDAAIAALEHGLLDATGPAGEKDMAELGLAWSDTEPDRDDKGTGNLG